MSYNEVARPNIIHTGSSSGCWVNTQSVVAERLTKDILSYLLNEEGCFTIIGLHGLIIGGFVGGYKIQIVIGVSNHHNL